MADINFDISPAPGITNDLIAVIYNTLAPSAEIARQVVLPPHPTNHTFNFANLPIGTYIVRIHQSPDGVTLGNLEHDFWVNASITTTAAYTIKTFQVGLGRSSPYYDPADQDTDYINPDLNGLDYLVFKPGYGPLDWAADITPYPGGGFSFTNNQKFAQGEIYTIQINNLVQTATSGSSQQSFPVGTIQITTDTTITSTHFNRIVEIRSPADCTLSIDLFSVPDGTQFCFNTHALFSEDQIASFRYAKISVSNGFIVYNGFGRTNMWIGRREDYTFYKTGGLLYVLRADDGYKRIGQIIYSFTIAPINSFPLQGEWIDQSACGRLFYDYVANLNPAELGTGTQDVQPDATNRTKWIVGSTKVWLPDHGGLFHRPNDIDGNEDFIRWPGEKQSDKVGPGQVKSLVFTGQGVLNNGIPGGTPGVGFLATRGDGGSITTDSASGTNNNSVRIDPLQIITGSGNDGQTRPKNVSVQAYVLS